MSDPTFAELLAMPGVIEECELRSSFGFMAYHGGALEETTDVIARQAADASGASYYGVVQPESVLIHIPSIRIGAAPSPTLATFLNHVDVVVTIHGYGRRPLFTSLLLGGRNRALATHLRQFLQAALPAYEIVDELERIPLELQGIHRLNPVNLPPHAGVQIELPPRARGSSPLWWDWEDGLTPHTRSLIAALATAAASWPA